MMDLGLSEKLVEVRETIRTFVEEKVEPVQQEYHDEIEVGAPGFDVAAQFALDIGCSGDHSGLLTPSHLVLESKSRCVMVVLGAFGLGTQ